MVDFRLSEEQISLQNLAKDFARKEIEPICASYDRKQDPKDCFPAHAFAKAIQFGLQSIYIPREYRGIARVRRNRSSRRGVCERTLYLCLDRPSNNTLWHQGAKRTLAPKNLQRY